MASSSANFPYSTTCTSSSFLGILFWRKAPGIYTCVIDAHEKRDVATVDIPGAFFQTKMPKIEDDVHVVLYGKTAELLAKICPFTYQKYCAPQKRTSIHILQT